MRHLVPLLLLTACHPRSTVTFEADLAGVDGASGPDLMTRTAAVEQTISSNSDCTPILNFYWEIGDAGGPLASGKVGTQFDGNSEMKIASASKMVWGAYVVERFKSDLSMIDFPSMSMQSGYTSLDYSSCVNSATVQDCFNAGNNSKQDANAVGHFYYDGGHFQHYAVELGLGPDDNDALSTEFKSVLGQDFAVGFDSPQMAGGMKSTPAAYAAFLRKILSGQLALHDQLGAMKICTLPASCPTAQYSPAAPYAWDYSYAHWVEDDPTSGDGAFSSAGAFGFYPWIDASKTYYGIVARYAPLEPKAYLQSAQCGGQLRKAFISGTAQ
jgi:hypothetical protein